MQDGHENHNTACMGVQMITVVWSCIASAVMKPVCDWLEDLLQATTIPLSHVRLTSAGSCLCGSSEPRLGLDKLCFYFNLLCFSVMLITCAYYAFEVNLLCSIMLQKLINNDGKYSQIYNCLYQWNRKRATSASATVIYIRRLGISHSKSKRCNHVSLHAHVGNAWL